MNTIKNLIANSNLPKHFWGRVTDNAISEFEREFGLTFPKDYREFLNAYGSGSIGSFEIYGLGYPETGIPNLVFLLKNKYATDIREILSLFKSIPISNDGNFVYLVTNDRDIDFGKITYFYESNNTYQKEIICDSFTKYLKEHL